MKSIAGLLIPSRGRLRHLTSFISNYRSSLLLMILTNFAATPVLGQFQVPVGELTSAHREVNVIAAWKEMEVGGPADGDSGSIINTAPGAWNQPLTIDLTNARASASQDSTIERFRVSGEAEGYAFLANELYSGSAGGLSVINFAFVPSFDVQFTLTANYEFEGQVATGWSRGQVLMTGVEGQGLIQHEIDSENADTWNVNESGTFTAGSPGYIIILVHAQRGRDPDLGDDETGESTAKVTFSIDFGDRDGDGLLDRWEDEDKIDLGDGAVIDLSDFDPDPDVKDLFVEVDMAYSDPSIDIETSVFPMVVKSFSRAPAESVMNYDNSEGVNLHVLVDENLPSQNLVLTLESINEPNDGPWLLPVAYYDIKKESLGTAAIRQHQLWDDGPLRQAWLLVFRYALWVDRIQIPASACTPDPDECSPGAFRQYGGWAEGFPSNDFVVAAGQTRCLYNTMDGATDEDVERALAGSFMHELGHTLNLRHGGAGQDSPLFKPNYLSVMNYAYASPIVKVTPQKTNAREVWLLDYSRWSLQELNENMLMESMSLNGPGQCNQPFNTGSGCKIVFNSASTAAPKPALTMAAANAAEFDWNNRDGIEEAVLMPPVDLSRFQYKDGENCGGTVIEPVYENLTSHKDWDLLVYPPPQNTIEPVLNPTPEVLNDKIMLQGSFPAQEMDQHTFRALMEADWLDQTAKGIFDDGFESN